MNYLISFMGFGILTFDWPYYNRPNQLTQGNWMRECNNVWPKKWKRWKEWGAEVGFLRKGRRDPPQSSPRYTAWFASTDWLPVRPIGLADPVGRWRGTVKDGFVERGARAGGVGSCEGNYCAGHAAIITWRPGACEMTSLPPPRPCPGRWWHIYIHTYIRFKVKDSLLF